MAGWLDDLLSMQAAGQPLPGGLLAMLGQGMGPSSGFPPNATSEQEQAAAEAARAAAAGRLARATRRPSPFDIGTAPGPDLYGNLTPVDSANLPPEATPTVGASTSPPEQYGIPPSFQGGVPYFAPNAMADASPQPSLPSASAPSAPIPAPGMQPDILGTIGRHIFQGLKDNSNSLIAGSGAMISGGLGKGFSALAAAAPLDIAARHERQANEAVAATYQAVLQQQLARGVAPAEARANALAASQNKEILTTLMGPQFQHVQRTGFLGDTEVGAFDPRTGKTTWGGGPTAGSGDIPAGLEGPPLMDWLNKNNSIMAAGVQGIIDGDINAAGKNLSKWLPVAKLVDPSLHQFDYQTRAKTRAYYTGGGAGALESKAANTAIEHAHQLSLIDKRLGGLNIGGGYLNPIIQGAKNISGNKDFQDALAEWNAKSETLAVEVAKAISGGVPHVADKEHWRQVFAAAATPNARETAIRSAMEIIQGREASAQKAYQEGMGSAKTGFTFINPENRSKYEYLQNYGRAGPAAAGQSAAAATVPSGASIGERKQFKQGWGVWNGQAWVPEK